MKKRILFCATVDFHFRAFHLPVFQWFQEKGWEVHVAAAGDLELPFVDKKFSLPIRRQPFHKDNWSAYEQLKRIIGENGYALIHCHTPVGGVLGRLAARASRKQGTKVLYTAHGFHFCKGAPVQNWLLYYPVERLLAHWTDELVTINHEDFSRAKQFAARHVAHVHGVGVDAASFQPLSQEEKRIQKQSFGFQPDDFLFFYAAEFNPNKQQSFLLRAFAGISAETPRAKLVLAGDGPSFEQCRSEAESLGIADRVHFLGLLPSVAQYVAMSDVAVASSRREGLPVNIMEAMACGLPVIATHNRGHDELIGQGVNGFLTAVDEPEMFAAHMKLLYATPELVGKMGSESIRLVQPFTLTAVKDELAALYGSYMQEVQDEAVNQYYRAYL